MLREEISELKSTIHRTDISNEPAEAVQAMKEEFDHLRGTLATAMIHSGSSADKDEMLEAIREGFESVRADLERRQDPPESVISNTGELIDALNGGLDGLRADVEKMVDKPRDMDMSTIYEIRDTLKEGLVNVRSDIDRLLVAGMEQGELSSRRGGEVVVADGEHEHTESLRRDDIENLEVMITQLRMKVEAFDNMPPPPPQPVPQPAEDALFKADLDGIEVKLKELQTSVAHVAQREQIQREDAATKDDTEAIETLLRNTKARIDEVLSSEAEGLARTSHVESLEATMLETRDAFHDLSSRIGPQAASKEDLGLLEALLKELRAGLEEMQEKATPARMENVCRRWILRLSSLSVWT